MIERVFVALEYPGNHFWAMEVNVHHWPKATNDSVIGETSPTGFTVIPSIPPMVGKGFAVVSRSQQRGAFLVKFV